MMTSRPVRQILQDAVQLQANGRLSEAEQRYRAILRMDRGDFNALHLLGTVRTQQGRYGDAADLIGKALKRHPGSAEAHSNLALALVGLGRHEDAVANCTKAIRLKPRCADAHNNLGLALHLLDRQEEAIVNCLRALELEPFKASAHNNLGLAQDALNRHEEAVASFRKAMALRPNYAEAHSNLGKTLQALGRYDDAISCYRGALAIRPDLLDAQWNESLAHLVLGDYTIGWRQYECRRERPAFPAERRRFGRPLWLGQSDLTHKRILLFAEQGLGDTLQFARYAQLVLAKGARVTLQVQSVLTALLEESMPGLDVVADEASCPRFDFHCPLLSLPLAFATTLDTIPATVPYLSVPALRLAQWKTILGDFDRPMVGLAWAGNRSHKNDRNRSIAVPRLRPLLSTAGIGFVSLQKELRDNDAEFLGDFPELLRLGDKLADFADTAAVVSHLDLVVTVDTSIAHLAGALNKPVWLLLPFAPDWRWLLGREDSPWYPSMRLFRQSKPGDWEGVVDRVHCELVRIADAHFP